MRDQRTTAQREADDNLDAAIRACQAAYADEVGTGLPTEWIVTGSAISADPDEQEDRSFILLPDGGIRTTRPHILGMLHSALGVIENEMREGM